MYSAVCVRVYDSEKVVEREHWSLLHKLVCLGLYSILWWLYDVT